MSVAHPVEGHVGRGFEAVRDVFADNFVRRRELGGACCVYYRGEKVVDLWGGIRNKVTGEPWERDTMVVVHSATKGLAAMTLAIAHSRGWLDYDERVATYWPGFAHQGKEKITVRPGTVFSGRDCDAARRGRRPSNFTDRTSVGPNGGGPGTARR